MFYEGAPYIAYPTPFSNFSNPPLPIIFVALLF